MSAPLPPSLPQNDPAAPVRNAELDKARKDYVFNYDYHGIVACESVPARDKTDPAWWGGLAKILATLEANKIASSDPKEAAEEALKKVEGALAKITPSAFGDLKKRWSQDAEEKPDDRSPEAYERVYGVVDAPPIVKRWSGDDIFAWQALAGTNPVMIARMNEALDHFPVTDAHVRAALGEGASLEAAMKDGRLYLADYALLDGVPNGQTDGLQKYCTAPLALYAWAPESAQLKPVAIQCTQRPDTPIFTPADGVSWRMARTAVSTAEGNFQGIVSHFALCHQVMESVILSAHRQLSSRHPVMVLLAPHFDNTLVTNEISMSSLISPDGYMDRLQSPTLEGSLALATKAIEGFDLLASAPHDEMARRGVDDTDLLPVYPYRDDGLLSWAAIHEFVSAYVRLYYASDAEVAADTEVAGWVREMGSREGGRLSGMQVPQTVDALIGVCAKIIFRCTVHHASINYTSFDFASFAPNVQAGGFGPGPQGGAADTEATLEAMRPPYAIAYQAFYLFYELTFRLNELGVYPDRHFVDPRVSDILTAYQGKLAAADATIAARDGSRLLPYPYLRPSQVSRSIHV